MKFINRIKLIVILLSAVVQISCGGADTGNKLGTDPDKPSIDAGDVLGSGTYSSNNRSWSYQKMRLVNNKMGYTYAQYFKHNDDQAHPVIVLTQPYLGIDWTQEAVDTRWSNKYRDFLAAGGSGVMCADDIDEPNYQAGGSATVCYSTLNSQQLGNTALVYLVNNFNVLISFGRFYSGGNIANDIEDTVASLRFLGTQASVIPSRIGILGSSWGGFQALYGALSAPATVKPAAVVALYPVSDFQGFINFMESELPSLVTPEILNRYNQFYDPFKRRIYAALGQPPQTRYQGYRLSDLSSLITMPILVPHDDGDTIIPATMSHNLVSQNINLVKGFWYKRRDPDTVPWQSIITKHGEIDTSTVLSAIYTFSSHFLLTRLANKEQNLTVVYGEQDIKEFFTNIKNYQIAGFKVDWLLPLLIELCDNRIWMLDVTPNSKLLDTGNAFVAKWLNQIWMTNYTDATVEQGLIKNGLPLP